MPTLIILQSPKSASLAVAVCGLRSLSRICMAVEHLLWGACVRCGSAQYSHQGSFSCLRARWTKSQRPLSPVGTGRIVRFDDAMQVQHHTDATASQSLLHSMQLQGPHT